LHIRSLFPAPVGIGRQFSYGERIKNRSNVIQRYLAISVATVRQVGWRPLLQGVLLWMAVAATSLWLIRVGVVSF